MQEVEQEIGRQIIVVIKGAARLTPRLLVKALKFAGKTATAPVKIPVKIHKKQRHGKMTVKELAEQNRGMTSIELHDSGFREFSRTAKKYGIDFAPYKFKGENKFMIFFKAPDTDAMTACVKEYTQRQIENAAKRNRPSVQKRLSEIRSGLKHPAPTAERHKAPVLQ